MHSTWIAPARAIASSSAGVFRTILSGRSTGDSDLVFEAQRRHRRPEPVVHLSGRAAPVEAPQQAALVVVLDQRRGLLVVDLEPVADRRLVVVVALDQA